MNVKISLLKVLAIGIISIFSFSCRVYAIGINGDPRFPKYSIGRSGYGALLCTTNGTPPFEWEIDSSLFSASDYSQNCKTIEPKKCFCDIKYITVNDKNGESATIGSLIYGNYETVETNYNASLIKSVNL